MIKREIIDGKYPDNNAEIALDRYTLRLIGEEDEIGSDIEGLGCSGTLRIKYFKCNWISFDFSTKKNKSLKKLLVHVLIKK